MNYTDLRVLIKRDRFRTLIARAGMFDLLIGMGSLESLERREWPT